MLYRFLLAHGRPALLLGLLLAGASAAQAQAPGNGGTTGGPPSPTTVPLDGGASLLLASGVAMGVRHLRQHRQRT